MDSVPNNWQVKPIKYVVTCNDDVLSEGTPKDFEIKYVEVGGVSEQLGIESFSTLEFGDAPSRARRLVAHGDTIVSTVRTYLRAIAPVINPPENLVVSTGFAVIRPKGIQSDFARYLLSTEYFMSEVISHSTGVSYPAINTPELMNIKVAIPTPKEQAAISIFLNKEIAKIDDLIQKQEKLVNFSVEARQALISHAVTKGINRKVKLRQTDVKWFGEIPSHWNHSKLGLYSKRVVVGIAEAATQAYQDSGTPILRATNIRPMKIIGDLLYLNDGFADDRESKSLNAGDLVTVRTGNAGVTALVPKELHGCQCFTMLITTVNDKLNPEFMNYWMNSSPAQSYFSIEGWGTAQVNISVPILKQLPIPIPPLSEQDEIVAYLESKTSEIDCLISKTKESLALLKERRDSLISAAVTGKIDVREAA